MSETFDLRAARGGAVRSPVHARLGMVAAAQPLAVQAGLDLLRAGGSAVDAAIATNACLGLMEPTANGLGGDLFAIVHDPQDGRLHGLNASGRAPGRITIDQASPDADGTIPLFSPFAWTVPGCADGWFELHRRFGRRSLAEVLAPAIRYCIEGFPVSPVIAFDWARSVKRFGASPGFAAVFLPGGKAPGPGDIFRNPALGGLLTALARDGRAAFDGLMAEAIARFSDDHGGFFSREDFSGHRSTWDAPISTTYRGLTVWELPPPGQGLAALELLNILETFDLASWGRASADFWHVFVEAKKLAYADRARYYADPEFARVPVAELLSKEYARKRAQAINLNRAASTDAPGDVPALNRSETTYLAAADGDGMMVSLIQSNYTGFGSGYVVPELGIGLQNRGALFALDPKHPNALAPGKRPFHTIIPAFVTRGEEPWLAFGLMGGDMQPQGHAQILVNLLDLGMNLQEAGDAPRFHHTGSSEPTGTRMQNGGVLHLEPGIAPEVPAGLERRGHRIESEATGAFGGYQAIARDPATGVCCGATESRKDGCAAGF